MVGRGCRRSTGKQDVSENGEEVGVKLKYARGHTSGKMDIMERKSPESAMVGYDLNNEMLPIIR